MKKPPLILIILLLFGGVTATAKTDNDDFSEKSAKQKNSRDVRLHIPVYAQKISIGLPNQSWKPIFESQKPNYRIEFVPDNEDPKNWENLISIQGYKGLVKNHYSSKNKSIPLLALFSFQLKKLYEKLCPKGKFVFNPGGKVDINTKKYIGFTMGCLVPAQIKTAVKQTNKGELGYYILVEGESDLYLMHKAVRGSEAFLKESLNEKNLAKFISPIEPIKLCETTGHIAECK